MCEVLRAMANRACPVSQTPIRDDTVDHPIELHTPPAEQSIPCQGREFRVKEMERRVEGIGAAGLTAERDCQNAKAVPFGAAQADTERWVVEIDRDGCAI